MGTDWHPRTPFAKTVHFFGFEYDKSQDILVSRLDPPIQYPAGFTWAYDVVTPGLLMAIDCEPFYFTHGGKIWMIELWKGQYGIETGGEIGVYHYPPSGGAVPDRDPEDTQRELLTNRTRWYASSRTLLPMQFVLTRDDGWSITRRAPHWWLTGFMWGEWTDSSRLTMEGRIQFPDPHMASQFYGAMQFYRNPHQATLSGTDVRFTFRHPCVQQPVSVSATKGAVMAANRVLVDKYRVLKTLVGAQSNDPNEFVVPDSWLDAAQHAIDTVAGKARAIENRAAAAAQAALAKFHGPAAAAAARLHAKATAAASAVRHNVAAAAGRIEDRLEDRLGVGPAIYRELMTHFEHRSCRSIRPRL